MQNWSAEQTLYSFRCGCRYCDTDSTSSFTMVAHPERGTRRAVCLYTFEAVFENHVGHRILDAVEDVGYVIGVVAGKVD
jgi:hypothetical protein